jgi:hypothetical protein
VRAITFASRFLNLIFKGSYFSFCKLQLALILVKEKLFFEKTLI